MRWSPIAWAFAAATATAATVDVAQATTTDDSTVVVADSAARPGTYCGLTDFRRLVPKLSAQAEIYYPGSSQFATLSQRWSNLQTPTVNVEVVPASEADVVEIVKAANTCNIAILAYNGAHGSITTLGSMDCGIGINLQKLTGVTIAANGQTATIAGGTNSRVVIDALWAAGKQTVTGTCECVSYMGPALGGGHGWLQGHYGLIADQFVSLNVVLADGSLKTVSATSNSDLWWAMKGAGHNFGIVTSATVKIYPKIHTTWAIETLMFTGDKVQAVYQAINDNLLQGGNQPVNIINWSYWFNLPPVDPTGPVMEIYIIQEGVTVVDPVYTTPFHNIGPIAITPNTGTYFDLARWTGIALDQGPCQFAGMANPRFPVYLPAYNKTAMQEVYDLFKAGTAGSSPFAGSLFMFEGYSMQGVEAVSDASTAYAFRADNLLVAPLIQYTPGTAALDAQAAQFGNSLRQALHRGSGRTQMHTYVNYAYGDETPKAWYGADLWRQDRLKALKKKYDPKGKFSFYAPAA